MILKLPDIPFTLNSNSVDWKDVRLDRSDGLLNSWCSGYRLIKNIRPNPPYLRIKFPDKTYSGGVGLVSWRSVLISSWIPDNKNCQNILSNLIIQFSEKRYGGGLDSWRSVGLEKQQQQYSESWRPKPEITWRNQDQTLGKFSYIYFNLRFIQKIFFMKVNLLVIYLYKVYSHCLLVFLF